ncbi:hypothetical protein BH20ACT14_BH20ACT14_06530 [soil metagenome]
MTSICRYGRIGSRSRRRIAADPGLIEHYNALKRAYEGGSYDEYQAAKRDFFYANFRL